MVSPRCEFSCVSSRYLTEWRIVHSWAGKGCLAGVNQYVSLEATGVGDSLDTKISRKEFLSSMACFVWLKFSRKWRQLCFTDSCRKRTSPQNECNYEFVVYLEFWRLFDTIDHFTSLSTVVWGLLAGEGVRMSWFEQRNGANDDKPLNIILTSSSKAQRRCYIVYCLLSTVHVDCWWWKWMPTVDVNCWCQMLMLNVDVNLWCQLLLSAVVVDCWCQLLMLTVDVQYWCQLLMSTVDIKC